MWDITNDLRYYERCEILRMMWDITNDVRYYKWCEILQMMWDVMNDMRYEGCEVLWKHVSEWVAYINSNILNPKFWVLLWLYWLEVCRHSGRDLDQHVVVGSLNPAKFGVTSAIMRSSHRLSSLSKCCEINEFEKKTKMKCVVHVMTVVLSLK